MNEQLNTFKEEFYARESAETKRIKKARIYAGTAVALEVTQLSLNSLQDEINHIGNNELNSLSAVISYSFIRSFSKYSDFKFRGSQILAVLSSFAIPSAINALKEFNFVSYDPKDTLPYAIGAGIAYGADKLIFKKNTKNEEVIYEQTPR